MNSKKPVQTVDLYRPNVPVKPRLSKDVWDIIAISALGGLWIVIMILIFA